MHTLVESVLAADVDDETILLDQRGGRYYGLNHTASRMLKLALAKSDDEACIKALAGHYDAPHETIRADLASLLSELEAKGLVRHEA